MPDTDFKKLVENLNIGDSMYFIRSSHVTTPVPLPSSRMKSSCSRYFLAPFVRALQAQEEAGKPVMPDIDFTKLVENLNIGDSSDFIRMRALRTALREFLSSFILIDSCKYIRCAIFFGTMEV